jgi:transposase-like protein
MTKKNGKQPVFDEAFKREAVRILSTGGRTVRQVADDLGVGFSPVRTTT